MANTEWLIHVSESIVLGLLGWALSELVNLKVRMAKMKKDVDAAHTAIRELKNKKEGT